MMRSMIIAVFLFVSPFNAYALQKGDIAPLFALRDNNGSYFYLSNYVGLSKKEELKGLIISFFASWCTPCRIELPILNSIAMDFEKRGLKVIVVGYKEDFDMLNNMLHQLAVNRPLVLSDKYGKVGEKYGVRSLPRTLFISRDGKIIDMLIGEVPEIEKQLRIKAKRLLEKN